MKKGRLEAFSDGVLAIILTIMVLDLRIPHESDFAALAPVVPRFVSYIVSFVYVGIYWNNHHHLFHAAKQVSARVMWENLHLLFWLSLVPFVTGWVGEHPGASAPMALYGGVLLMSALAWLLLQKAIIVQDGPDSELAQAVGKDLKGTLSGVLYAVAIGLSFVNSWLAFGIYSIVAIIWFVPDRRIERRLRQHPQ